MMSCGIKFTRGSLLVEVWDYLYVEYVGFGTEIKLGTYCHKKFSCLGLSGVVPFMSRGVVLTMKSSM